MEMNDYTDLMAMNEVLKARASFYRMLSSLYFNPLKEDEIVSMSRLLQTVEPIGSELFDSGIKKMKLYLRRINTGTRQELAVDFTSSFGGVHTYEEQQALPYRSLFMDNESPLLFSEGHRIAYNSMKTHCVKKREGLDYPDDHISFLCEFIALLSDRASSSLEELISNNVDNACCNLDSIEGSLKTSLEVLDEQILTWFSSLVEVAEKIITTMFYQGVLEVSEGYFQLDREVLLDMLNVVKEYRFPV